VYKRQRQYIDRAAKADPKDKRPEELLKLVEQIEEKELNYAAKMKEAEAQASAGNFTKAIACLEQAKQIKPEETTPQKRIDELTQQQNDLANEAQKNQLYKDFMSKGLSSKSTENYEQALIHFQNALSVKKDDADALAKIAEVQGILDDIANSKKNEAERKNQFDEFVRAGEAQMGSEDFVSAEKSFEEALKIDPNNSIVRVKFEEAKRRSFEKNTAEADKAYQQLLKEGDDFFTAKSYDKAKEIFERAKTQRPSDKHPIDKLAEIDAILNPVIVDLGTLEDLGEPFDISTMDGAAALQEAELARNNLKSEKIQNQLDGIYKSEAELTQSTLEDNSATSNRIDEILIESGADNANRDMSRKEAALAIEEIEQYKAEEAAVNERFASADHRFAQEKIDLIEQESESSSLSLQDAQSIDATYKELSKIENQRDKDAVAYQKELQESNLELEKVIVRAATINEMTSERYLDKSHDTQEEIQKNDLLIAEKVETDAKRFLEYKENIDAIEQERVLIEMAAATTAENHSKDIVDQLSNTYNQMSDVEDQRELARQENLVKIESILTEAENAEYQEFLEENEKFLKTMNEIEKIQEDVTENDENAEVRRTEVLTSISEIEMNYTAINEAAIENDDKERQSTNGYISTVDQTIGVNTKESIETQRKSTAEIKNVISAADADAKGRGEMQQDKAQETQKKLDNIQSNQPTKVSEPNSLGKEYPEGVSQETFKKNDENGLLVAVITRRVVVINGEGNVYVRMQTNLNMTYTKNGQPSTEYVWQKETQGANLKKNY
jgi:epidermal growth factor receptor substrate 15